VRRVKKRGEVLCLLVCAKGRGRRPKKTFVAVVGEVENIVVCQKTTFVLVVGEGEVKNIVVSKKTFVVVVGEGESSYKANYHK
jgi:hypothetical protein